MMPTQLEIRRLHADICASLSDPTRIAILYLLDKEKINVKEMTARLDLPQSTVSRHLRVLRETNLVRGERSGQNIYYQLTDDRVIVALNLLREVLHARVDTRSRAFNASSSEE